MNRLTTFFLVALLTLPAFAVGCDSDDDEAADDEPAAEQEAADDEAAAADEADQADEPSELVLKAQQLGPLADTLRQDPASLDAWLDEQEMTEEELEELLFDISADPEASEAYAEARQR